MNRRLGLVLALILAGAGAIVAGNRIGLRIAPAWPFLIVPSRFPLRLPEPAPAGTPARDFVYFSVSCEASTPDLSCARLEENGERFAESLVAEGEPTPDPSLRLLAREPANAPGRDIRLCRSGYGPVGEDERLRRVAVFSVGRIPGRADLVPIVLALWHDAEADAYVVVFPDYPGPIDQASRSDEYEPCTLDDQVWLKTKLAAWQTN